MIPSRGAALVYRIALVAVSGWALALLLGLDRGAFEPAVFVFFTSLSNLAVFVWAALETIVTVRDIRRSGWRGASTPSARAAGYPLMSIIVTMLIYLIVLTPTVAPEDLFTLQDSLVHVVVPIMMILDWLAFTPKGHQRWFDPLLWAVPPYVYLAWAFLHHALGGTFSGRSFPYPFMDVDVLGWGGFALYLLVLTVGLELVAYMLHGIDRVVGRARAARVHEVAA